MALQPVNLGIGTTGADTLYNGAVKINANFTEIYTAFGNGSALVSYVGYAGSAGISTLSNYATIAGYSTSSGVSTTSGYATIAGYSTSSGVSTTSSFATIAGYSTSSGIATNAQGLTGTPNISVGTISASSLNSSGVVTASSFSGSGTNLTGIVTSIVAGTNVTVSSSTGQVTINAGVATYASNAGVATYATIAGYSTSSGISTTSGYATIAGYSTSSGIATYASTAGIASYVSISGLSTSATYAISAGIATYATIAGYSTSSGVSTTSGYATIAGYSTSSGVSTSATTASYATIAGYSTSSGVSTTASYATIAGYSTSSGIATNATSASYATISGYSTSSGVSTTATYATIAGYSTSSGISSTLISTASVNTTGIITATTFVGNLTGNVTGNATGLSGNPNITVTNAVINGTLSVGGTSVILNAATLQINDRDIVVGYTTDAGNNDVSNDTTANHGGISVASTVGYPIINIPLQSGINSNPSTYKQWMWIKQGNYSGMGTDAWVSNYAVSIGNTATLQNNSRLTVGAGFTVYDTYLDATDIRARNLNVTGVSTFAGITTNTSTLFANQLSVSGVTTHLSTTLIGSGTSTGTASQLLQVTGGAYVSGNLGIGSTIPSTKLDVLGAITASSTINAGGTIQAFQIFQSSSGTDIVLNANGANRDAIFQVNGSELMRLQGSTGRLGIGNASPGANLDVYTSSSRYIRHFPASGLADLEVLSNNNVQPVFAVKGTGTADLFRAYANTTQAVTLDSSGNLLINRTSATGTSSQPLQVNGGAYVSGNLGVGVTAPITTLHVDGTGNQYIRVSSSTHSNFIQSFALSGNTGHEYKSVYRIVDTDNGERARFDSSGRLGIGTTNPVAALQVQASTTSTGVGTQSNPTFIIQNTRLNTGTSGVVLRFDNNEISGTTPFQRAAIGAEYDGASNLNGRLMFATADSSGNLQERARIDGSGRLGIGTNNPTAVLHVSANDFVRITRNSKDLTINANYSALNQKAQFQTDTGMDLAFATNGDNERMRITSTGNVGIGTISFSSKLQVQGTIGLSAVDDLESSLPGGRTKLSTSASGFVINHVDNSSIIFNTTAIERARIDSSGNVGINTTSPSATLHVQGNALVSYSILNSTLQVNSATDALSYFTVDGDSSYFSYAGTYIGLASKPGYSIAANLYVGGGYPIIPSGWTGTISASAAANATSLATTVYLQTSTDGTTWTTRDNTSGSSGKTLSYSVTSSATPLYVRFNFAQSSGGSVGAGNCSISNLTITNLPVLPKAPSISSRLTVDSSGRVTTPNQPRAHIPKNTGQTLTTSASKIIFDAATYDIGSNYSDTNDRYTAPVAGYYFVTTSINVLATTNVVTLLIYKNGAQYGNLAFYATSANVRINYPISGIVYCNASDYIEVFGVVNSGTVTVDNSGYLSVGLLG